MFILLLIMTLLCSVYIKIDFFYRAIYKNKKTIFLNNQHSINQNEILKNKSVSIFEI